MPTNVLVSGASERVEAVSAVLRAHDCTVVEVDDLERVPQACAEAGEQVFDAYVQLPAYFGIEGRTALERLHHFYVAGVLPASAMNAAVPALKPGGRIMVVAWPLPAEVATDDDIEARRALYRVLAHGAQADAGNELVVRVLGSSTSPEDIALAALGKESADRPASRGSRRCPTPTGASSSWASSRSSPEPRSGQGGTDEGGRGGRQRNRGRDRRWGRAHRGAAAGPGRGGCPVDDPARAADEGDGDRMLGGGLPGWPIPGAAAPDRGPAPDGGGSSGAGSGRARSGHAGSGRSFRRRGAPRGPRDAADAGHHVGPPGAGDRRRHRRPPHPGAGARHPARCVRRAAGHPGDLAAAPAPVAAHVVRSGGRRGRTSGLRARPGPDRRSPQGTAVRR